MDNEKITNNQPEEKQEAHRPTSRRYNKQGYRRGKYAYAAPLGFLISFLCIVGVVALIVGAVKGIQHLTDTSDLKDDFYYFLEPVLTYNPEPFEDIAETEQDAFLLAAAYRVSLAEQVRMLVEADENCRYPVDDQGRITVPVTELETSYVALFGPDAPLTHRTLEKDNLEYSESDGAYYVPFQSLSTGYVAVIDTVKHRGDTYTVRVAYVANNDVQVDAHGNQINPTADMAAYFQTYVLEEYGETYYIQACSSEQAQQQTTEQ